MKSIGKILLTTIVIMLCSCQRPDTSTAKPVGAGSAPIAHRFIFEGHSYIGFKYRHVHGCTIIHDPDCKCNKKNKSY